MLTGNRNTDEYLLKNFLDDKSLMNAVSSNKELLKKGEEIFKERLRNNYPYLYKRKPFLESYRNYYLKMMYYIGKLKEEFGVDYIPVSSFDPEGVYRGFSLKRTEYVRDMNFYLSPYYAELGDEEKLKGIAKSRFRFMKGAVLNDLIVHGNIPLYEKLLREWQIDPLDIDESGIIFQNAVKSGNKEIINIFNAKVPMDEEEREGGRKYFGAIGAAEIGSLETLEYINELFPDDLLEEEDIFDIILAAAENGHIEFVRSFLNAPNFEFLFIHIPSMITELTFSISANFLPEDKVKRIIGMLMDYYFANGGDRKSFEKRFKKYAIADPEITKFVRMKLEEYESRNKN